MKKKRRFRILRFLALLLILLTAAGFLYVHDELKADPSVRELLAAPPENVRITEVRGKRILFEPEEPIAGLIFYPGGKVDFEAYIPLMMKLAEKDIFCVLPHMPGNFAFMDINAADRLMDTCPQITDWYIGGHSLGGAMAAFYAASNADRLQGLILLAAYSTKDLTGSGLNVLSVYGSEDGVLNLDAYKRYLKNLPEAFTELLLEGGCHSFFGSYGLQKGDGTPTLSMEEQLQRTADAAAEMVMQNEKK